MLMELKDRLDAMRKQEVHYRCCDYTQPPSIRSCARKKLASASPASSACDLVHLWLDECAALVTDPLTRLDDDSVRASLISSPRKGSQKLTIPKSPSGVDQYPGDEERDESSTAHRSDNTLDTSAPQDIDFYLNNPDLGTWRLQMFDWACMVVDGFQMDRCEVLATAFNLLDRYTTLELKHPNSPPVTREDYQLFAMTSVYMAVKILEPFPRKMGLVTLSVMSRDFYKPQDIASTEIDMLAALNWRTTPPSSIAFCRELVQFLFPNAERSGADLEQIFSTICDVTVSDPSFLNYSPSIISVAALLHTARLTGSTPRERLLLQKQALGALGAGDDEYQVVQLEAVYAKMERLYC